MPERAFFVGNFLNKVAKWGLLFAGLLSIATGLVYPASLKADTVAITAAAAAGKPCGTCKTVWVTAYASVPEETSSHPFITASGQMVHDGTVAANWLPFGTLIKIPRLFGDKIFVVEDRMNKVFSKRLDIWMPTVHAATMFGIQHAEVVVVGNENDDGTLATVAK